VEAKGHYIATVKALSGGKREREKENKKQKQNLFYSKKDSARWCRERICELDTVHWGDTADKRGILGL
jgi:hypothetical protein